MHMGSLRNISQLSHNLKSCRISAFPRISNSLFLISKRSFSKQEKVKTTQPAIPKQQLVIPKQPFLINNIPYRVVGATVLERPILVHPPPLDWEIEEVAWKKKVKEEIRAAKYAEFKKNLPLEYEARGVDKKGQIIKKTDSKSQKVLLIKKHRIPSLSEILMFIRGRKKKRMMMMMKKHQVLLL
jgi:hypothetical protein